MQISDAFVVNDHIVNETGLQFERAERKPLSRFERRAPSSGTGEFTAGGYPAQVYRDHAMRLELQNLTTLSHGAHAIKFGTRLRDTRDANFTNSNYNGAFRLRRTIGGHVPPGI